MAVPPEANTETAEALSAWEDALDPPLRDKALEYLGSLLTATTTTPPPFLTHEDDSLRVDLQRRLKPFQSNKTDASAVAACGIVAVLIAMAFGLRFEPWYLVLAIGIIGIVLLTRVIAAEANRAKVANYVPSDLLPVGLKQVAQNRIERAYVAAVTELFPSDTNGYLSSNICWEQMEGLNTLLTNGRRLESVAAEIATVLKEAQPEALEKELESLRHRLERTNDEATRDALAQSIALCEERRTRNTSLLVLAERLDAESELVYQAFGATRSALTALRVSPATANLYADQNTPRISEVAENIARQTRAVEAAVQELGIRSE